MPSFGVVAEGITDQRVIENILQGYLGNEDDEPVVNYVQPPLDKTGSHGVAYGGWGLVFDFLRRGEYRNALQTNDFLVLQIDTDVSQQVGYDVPWREGGRELTPADLVARVVQKLESLIDEEFYRKHAARFVFAVAVDGIECWLLPLLYNNNKAEKTTGCLEAANHELKLKNRKPLKHGEHKDPRAYDEASRAYAKRATLMKQRSRNPSLDLFIEDLAKKTVAAAVPPENPAEPSASKAAGATPAEQPTSEHSEESGVAPSEE